MRLLGFFGELHSERNGIMLFERHSNGPLFRQDPVKDFDTEVTEPSSDGCVVRCDSVRPVTLC